MRRTDIIGDITGDRQSEGRGEARTLPKTNWQPGRATTSLTPYGMSFWALILAACGGGGGGGGGGRPTTAGASQMLQREGYVYDGPVKGAVVYVDADDDGQLNPGRDEYVGTTDSSGAFRGSISAQNRGKRYIVDLTRAKDLGNDKIEGTADDQDLSKFGTWLAPEGASVVSALTHLIAKGVYKEQEVKSTFPGFDPLRDNPYKQGLTPDKEKAFEIVRKALPGITRLVKEHSDLIEENTRRIERNSEDLEALKDELNALKAQVSAIKEAAAQPDPAPPNTLPTAADDNAGPVDEGATVRGNVRANDRDAETARDSLVVNAVWAGDGTGGAAGRIGEALQGVYGRLTLNADGGYSYVAGTNADRPVDDVFTYRIADADGGVHTAKLTIRVNGVAPPNTEQPGPTNPSSDMPSSLTLGFENRNSGQRIDETTDISQTVEPIKTGLVLTSSVSGLFAAARGNGDNRPIINILSRQQDGSFVVDNDRFTIRENGKLSVKRYAHLDYESEHNPNGQIDLRIVVSYNNGPSAVQHISVFLNNLNDAPVGELRLVQYANGNPTPVETRLFEYLSVPVNTRIGFDKNGFSDPDRNTLTYTTKWISPDRITVSSEDTFTPDRSGQYYLQVEVSDGRITTPIRHLVIFNVQAPQQPNQAPQQPNQPQPGTGNPPTGEDGSAGDPPSEQPQRVVRQSTVNQSDTHTLDKTRYRTEENADYISGLETHDRISVDLPYILVRHGYDEVNGVRQRKDVLYNPHDVSLDDNVLALVSEYGNLTAWKFASLRENEGSFFARRPDGSTTLDYIIREQRDLTGGRKNLTVNGDNEGRDAFMFDGGPSARATAPVFSSFHPDEGDRLLFTGDNATIYWQVKFISAPLNQRNYELIFYSSKEVRDDNVLAVFEIPFSYYGRAWHGEHGLTTPTDSMFLPLNKPALETIPAVQRYVSINGIDSELNPEMAGTRYVTDYFTSIPHSDRLATIGSYNIVTSNSARDKVPVISDFEDGRDKIVLEPADINAGRKIWWSEETMLKFPNDSSSRETIDVIVLYNVANPNSEDDSHKIAIIKEFEGTFSYEDFVSANPDIAIPESLIVEIV